MRETGSGGESPAATGRWVRVRPGPVSRSARMKILYVASSHPPDQPEGIESYAEVHVHDTLKRLGHEVMHFDPLALERRIGHVAANLALGRVADQTRPDLLLAVLAKDPLDPAGVQAIRRKRIAPTGGWRLPESERSEPMNPAWATAFDWWVSESEEARSRAATRGQKQVLLLPWAANHFRFRRLDLPLEHDVSFVGRATEARVRVLEGLRLAGVKVVARGLGWPGGLATTDEMIALHNQSRISLNLADVPPVAGFVKRLLAGPPAPVRCSRRVFEIAACGGLALSAAAEDLGRHYAIGTEVIVFGSLDDLVGKVRHYLKYETERARVVKAAHLRTLRDHTYAQRLETLLREVGLRNPAAPVPPSAPGQGASCQ